MNTFQFSFLGLLLGFLTLRISSAETEKPGECPPERYLEPYSQFIPSDSCQDDYDCPGDQKCCSDNEYNFCKPPDNDRCGSCPGSLTSSERCTDYCTSDSECTADAKCCWNGCGYDCLPYTGDKPGFCRLEKVYMCIMPERSFCANDAGCPDDYKCCSSGCSHNCQQPLSERSGQCPPLPPASESEVASIKTDHCTSDYDCDSPTKCCDTEYGKACTMPWEETK